MTLPRMGPLSRPAKRPEFVTPPRRAPLLRLNAIVLIGHVSVTTPLVHRCAADGRDIVWVQR
jgi:CRISPR/Cas system-associated endonuclease Cas1